MVLWLYRNRGTSCLGRALFSRAQEEEEEEEEVDSGHKKALHGSQSKDSRAPLQISSDSLNCALENCIQSGD